jgi:HEAT repeat protein
MEQDQVFSDAEAKFLQSLESLELSVSELKNRHFAALAGPLAESLLQHREQAEAALADSDSKVKRAAILAIVDHWGSSPPFEEYCITTLFLDRDTDLRITALSALTKIYQGSSAKKAIQILIEVLRNDTNPEKLRALAYLALFHVSGKPVDPTVRLRILRGQFLIAADVDWSLVESFS